MVVMSNTTYYCDKCGKVIWSREQEEKLARSDANNNRIRMWTVKLKAMPITATTNEIRDKAGLFYCTDCMGGIVRAMGLSWRDMGISEYEPSERGN